MVSNWPKRQVGATLCKVKCSAQCVDADSLVGDDIVASVSVLAGLVG